MSDRILVELIKQNNKVLGGFKENITKQITILMKHMSSESSKHISENQVELKKKLQNMNTQQRKERDHIKSFKEKSRILEI